jgi:3-methyladenine DNA glycosylase AlkD
MPTVQEVLQRLQALANPENVAGMERFGINPQGTLGISIYVLRPLAKEIGIDHKLALELWQSGIHEARILAAFIDDAALVDEAQLEAWVRDFDSWDVCDQVCSSLFDRTPYAWDKAVTWSERDEEFVKRAGFVLMAALAAHAKNTPDERFEPFFEIILREACDERNFVKKAVNWALRGIGKRSQYLNRLAIEAAQRMAEIPCRAARWNAKDALRELQSEKIQKRLSSKRPN